MIVEHVRQRFAYDHWANDRALQSLRTLPEPPEKACRWLGHIVVAHRAWFMRLHNERPSKVPDMFPLHTLEELEGQLKGLRDLWADYLASLTEEKLSTILSYHTNKGDLFESPVLDILTHVTNHSTYHRGQIASAVRESGGSPLATDFIIFSRGG